MLDHSESEIQSHERDFCSRCEGSGQGDNRFSPGCASNDQLVACPECCMLPTSHECSII